MAWNRSAEGAERRTCEERPVRRWRGAVAAVLVVGGAVVAWVLLSPAPKDVGSERRNGVSRSIGEAKPAKAVRPAELKLPRPSGKRVETRADVAAPQPLEELEAALTNRPPKTAGTPFRNAAEQLIALATPSAPGVDVPPLPDISDERLAADVAAAERHVISAEEGDTEELLGRKLAVAAAKEQFLDLRASEGCTFSEYLKALRDQANMDADFLREAHQMLDGIYHDEAVSDNDYEEYRKQVNEKLRDRGLPEIN